MTESNKPTSKTSESGVSDINTWFNGPMGERLLENEMAVLDQLLPGFFGYHLMQLSIQDQALFNASQIRHKFSIQQGLDNSLVQTGEGSMLISEDTHLPLGDDSIDVILLHHLLEFHSQPQNLLREVSRVSLPNGQIVIIGFNPISLWGAWKPFGAMRGQAPWTGKFIGPGRLMDWLNLLNFKIDRAKYLMYGIPTTSVTKATIPDYSQGLSRKANWPFGAVYVIVARKQVAKLIPMKPIWQRSKAFGRLSVVPSARPATGRVPTTNISSSRDVPPGE